MRMKSEWKQEDEKEKKKETTKAKGNFLLNRTESHTESVEFFAGWNFVVFLFVKISFYRGKYAYDNFFFCMRSHFEFKICVESPSRTNW